MQVPRNEIQTGAAWQADNFFSVSFSIRNGSSASLT
jgi:hypothetical protein